MNFLIPYYQERLCRSNLDLPKGSVPEGIEELVSEVGTSSNGSEHPLSLLAAGDSQEEMQASINPLSTKENSSEKPGIFR